MKAALTALIPAAVLAACTLQAQPNYTVTFPAPEGSANMMAWLIDWDSSEKIDSTVITGDTIRFSGTVETPFIGRIMLGASRGPIFYVEPGTISVSSDGMASGTPLNEKQTEAITRLLQFEQDYSALDQNDSIQRIKADSIAAAAMALPEELYKANSNSPFGLYWFMQRAYEMTLPQLEAAAGASPVIAASPRVQALLEAMRKKGATGVGTHYTDFSVEYDGKVQKFSDYVKPGEYTLVDFWASWCGPCMRQAKVIKELYAKYRDKGLNVVGVAVWDEPANTLAAISSHGLEWPNIINAQTIPTDIYGISGIPCIMLIDPQGIIVSRDKMGQDLIDDVDAAMSSYAPAAPEQSVTDSPAAPADTAVIF